MFCRLSALLGRRLGWNRWRIGPDRHTATYVLGMMMMT